MATEDYNNELKLDDEQRKAIITALLIGLESFGEVERVINRFDIEVASNQNPFDDLRPIHPTGCSDTVGVFAAALRYLHV